MEAKQVWQAALERVRCRVSPSAFTTWFSGTVGFELRQSCLAVVVPSTFAREHLGQRFAELARIAVSEVIGRSAEITFIVRESTPPRPAPAARTSSPGRATAPRTSAGSAARPRASRLAQQVAVLTEPRPAQTGTRRSGAPGRSRFLPDVAQPPLVDADTAPPRSAAVSGPRGQRVARPTPPLPLEPAPAPDAALLPESTPAAPHEASGSMYDLHPRYVFESYVVASSNRLAYAAALEVASAPGERYNPLFIYGGVGLGKTHLLHAIGNRARACGLHVAYVTAERFTNEIIEAIRQRTTDFFRARYRAVDVLLVDDVQFIAGRESTEEEFFHTFNTLHEANKQIVLSSDRVPHAMPHLHDRLRSRFGWGLLADIQPPDFAHRMEILRAKAASLRAAVPEDVLVWLARPECENIRTLEGTLNRVVAYARMLGRPLDARLVAQAVAPLAGEALTQPLDGEAVVAAVARHFGVRVEDLRGKSREHGIAWARQVAMYLLREETPASLLQIGRQLGGRDHTTVMHGCSRVSKALDADARLRTEIATLRATLRGQG
jgi:chromosomal replication initiator protein